MFIANTTRQVHDFVYRLPENKAPLKQVIEIGSQIKISKDLTRDEIDGIIEQHSMYGLVAADEVDRRKPFIGLCYSIDKPVNVSRIQAAIAHNDDVLTEQGQQFRKEAAVQASNVIGRENSSFEALRVEISEVPARNQESAGLKEKIIVSDGEVDGDGEPVGNLTRRQKSRRARQRAA